MYVYVSLPQKTIIRTVIAEEFPRLLVDLHGQRLESPRCLGFLSKVAS